MDTMGLLLASTVTLLNASLMLLTIVSHKGLGMNLDFDQYLFKWHIEIRNGSRNSSQN